MFSLTDREEVSRGQLSRDQVVLLDETLAGHGLPQTSSDKVIDHVAFVCLQCGSVGVCSDNESRDSFINNCDATCCGLTVTFHSDHRVLVNTENLVVRSVN